MNKTRNDELRDLIRSRARMYLEPDGKKKGYICPVCGSGTGANGTGISKDGIHFTCWAGCFQNSDLIDIIGLQYGIEGYTEKLQKAIQVLNLDKDMPINDQKWPKIEKNAPQVFRTHRTQKMRIRAI